MAPEQRLAALAALGLFVSMFLPWYSQTDTVVVGNAAKATQTSLSAFDAFSFVEAAVLLVSAGVLALLFARVERHAFQLPGGDGTIVMIAGGWTALLIFYRLLDKPGLQGTQRITATVGVQWGIFIALLLALGLVYAGGRIRAAERPEPPLTRTRGQHRQPDPEAQDPYRRPRPEEDLPRSQPDPTVQGTVLTPEPARPKRSTPVGADRRSAPGRPRYPPAPPEQMSFEDPPPGSD
jgi:hypothetical protein